jgi:hypothetical protein
MPILIGREFPKRTYGQPNIIARADITELEKQVAKTITSMLWHLARGI